MLGTALRVDALERSGDLRKARDAYRRGARGQALVLANTLTTYGLAPKTRKRNQFVGFLAMGLIAMLACVMGLAIHGDTLAALGLLGVAGGLTVLLKLL